MPTAIANSVSRFGWLVWDALAGFGRFTEFVFAVIAQLTAHPAKCRCWARNSTQSGC